MKTILITLSSVLALAAVAFAANDDKEVTVSGKVLCAHCDLEIGDSCNSAVKVEGNLYLLTGKVSEKFFDENEKVKAVTATGKATKKDDHIDLAVSKIALKSEG